MLLSQSLIKPSPFMGLVTGFQHSTGVDTSAYTCMSFSRYGANEGPMSSSAHKDCYALSMATLPG